MSWSLSKAMKITKYNKYKRQKHRYKFGYNIGGGGVEGDIG
jgi:hypothetical protein